MQEDKKAEKQKNKAKLNELNERKKEVKKEINDLNGRTVKGKVLTFLVFLLLMLVMLGTFVGMVKLNVGGIADNVLAPVIGDVPVIRSILPKSLQRKNAKEIAAEKQAIKDAKAADKAQKQAQIQADADEKAAEEAKMQAASDAQASADAQEAADEQAAADAQKEAEIQDYADTYAKVDPVQVAKIFTEMMPGDCDLIAKILQHMSANKRADIITNMDPLVAAQITVVMEK